MGGEVMGMVGRYVPRSAFLWLLSVTLETDIQRISKRIIQRTTHTPFRHELTVLRTFDGHKAGVHWFAWCQAGKFIVSGGVSRELLVWNPYSCTTLHTLEGHNNAVKACVVDDQNGRMISVSAFGDKVTPPHHPTTPLPHHPTTPPPRHPTTPPPYHPTTTPRRSSAGTLAP